MMGKAMTEKVRVSINRVILNRRANSLPIGPGIGRVFMNERKDR